MNQLFRDAFTWPRLFDVGTAPGSRPGFGVTCNLYEKDDSYIMQVLLPGVKVDDLQITAHQNVLTLQGIAGVAAPEGARGIWVSLGDGEFSEQVTLPGEVDAEKASADDQDGVLALLLPKAAHMRPKTITLGGRNQQPALEGQSS